MVTQCISALVREDGVYLKKYCSQLDKSEAIVTYKLADPRQNDPDLEFRDFSLFQDNLRRSKLFL